MNTKLDHAIKSLGIMRQKMTIGTKQLVSLRMKFDLVLEKLREFKNELEVHSKMMAAERQLVALETWDGM
jgi:hypothetical protein